MFFLLNQTRYRDSANNFISLINFFFLRNNSFIESRLVPYFQHNMVIHCGKQWSALSVIYPLSIAILPQHLAMWAQACYSQDALAPEVTLATPMLRCVRVCPPSSLSGNWNIFIIPVSMSFILVHRYLCICLWLPVRCVVRSLRLPNPCVYRSHLLSSNIIPNRG